MRRSVLVAALLSGLAADAKTGAYRGNIYAIACIGDSITQGTGLGVATVVNSWPAKLGESFSDSVHVVTNTGVGGTQTAYMKGVWQNALSQGGDWSAVAVLGGINDASVDVSASTIFANLQAIYDGAHAAGATVVAITIMPFKTATVVTWTSGRQTIIDTVNASIRTYVSNNSSNTVLVDAYALFGGQGGDPQLILTSLDSGDHLHPNQTGQNLIASSVKTALGF
jgi:lysophospholipase L1-like esterase